MQNSQREKSPIALVKADLIQAIKELDQTFPIRPECLAEWILQISFESGSNLLSRWIVNVDPETRSKVVQTRLLHVAALCILAVVDERR